MRKELRSIGLVWLAVIVFAIIIISGTSIGPVVYTFNDGVLIHMFDLFVAIPAIVAWEFTVRMLNKISSENVDQFDEAVNQSLKKVANIYESSPRADYMNVETQPMKIVVEQL